MNNFLDISGFYKAVFETNRDDIEIIINDEYVTAEGINSRKFFNSIPNVENLNGSQFRYEYYQQVNNIISISEISDNGQELRLSFKTKEEKKEVLSYFNTVFELNAVFIHGIQNNEVINIIDDNDTILVVLKFPQDDINLTDNVIFRVKRLESKTYTFTFNQKRVAVPDIILRGNKKDNLQNFYYKTPKKYSQKTYGDVQGAKSSLSEIDFSRLDTAINIDFSKFENHVRFGSANSKVVNAKTKIEDPTVEKETYTLYERWVVTQIEGLNGVETELWFEKEKEKAISYDTTNNELVLYNLPRYFIENDEYGYLTNFVLFIGEFFDNIFTTIRGFDTLNEFSLHEMENISPKLIEDVLVDLGFDMDVRYSEADFQDYFENEDNLKKVSNELSQRLINTLPYLTKMKGTRRAIEYIFNTFGINHELFSINEYGSLYVDGVTQYEETIKEWFLSLAGTDTVTIDVSTTEVDWNNHTFEFIYKNLNSSGTLFSLGVGSDFDYAFDGTDLTFSYEIDSNAVVNGSVPYDGERIVVFAIVKQNDDVKVMINQKSPTGEIYSSHDFVGTYALAETFAQVVLSGQGDLTEFRVFDSEITENELEYHTLNIRSTSEDIPSTLITRYYFRRADLLDYPVALGTAFNVTFNNTIEDDFNKFSTKNISETNSIFSNDIHSDKIRIRQLELNSNDRLSFKKKKAEIQNIEFVNDPPYLSIHLSQADIINKRIIESLTKNATINPEWNAEYDYNFTNLISLKNQLDSDIIFDNYNILNELSKLINLKIFNILRIFIPESVEFTYGVEIKNSILEKSKEKYVKKSAVQRDGWTQVDATTYTIKKSDLIQKNVVFTIVEDLTTAKKSLSVRENLPLIFKTDDSQYIESITGYEDAWKSPYLRRTIRGKPEDSEILTPDQLREFLNFGAKILVI